MADRKLKHNETVHDKHGNVTVSFSAYKELMLESIAYLDALNLLTKTRHKTKELKKNYVKFK